MEKGAGSMQPPERLTRGIPPGRKSESRLEVRMHGHGFLETDEVRKILSVNFSGKG
jgi:hypothetical protein